MKKDKEPLRINHKKKTAHPWVTRDTEGGVAFVLCMHPSIRPRERQYVSSVPMACSFADSFDIFAHNKIRTKKFILETHQ
jgi:hypothetical protein